MGMRKETDRKREGQREREYYGYHHFPSLPFTSLHFFLYITSYHITIYRSGKTLLPGVCALSLNCPILNLLLTDVVSGEIGKNEIFLFK
jgi:hypothetical protein